MRVSRAYNAQEHECGKFEKGNRFFVKSKGAQYKVMGEFHSTMTFFTDFLYFAVLLAGGLFFYFDKIDVGEFTAFVLYISTLITPVRTLITIFDQIQEGATGFKRFCEIMDTPAETDDGKLSPEKLGGGIEFKNVSFSYKNEEGVHSVIRDFSLKIPAGKTVALVGPSGGGKTTLCHLIPRFYEIDGGSITVDGHDIRDLTRQSLRANVGIVQQDVFLFNGTVRQNIAYGNFEATDE